MTTTPEIGAELRRVADARTVTDPAVALARWHESELPGYEVAPPSGSSRRLVRLAAVVIVLAGMAGFVALRPGESSDAPLGRLTGPSAPGVPLAVTAGMGWVAQRTADGWVVQHPADWTVTEAPPCGGGRVVLVVMDPSSSDACGRLAGSVDLGPLSGFLAVREVDRIAETPQGTTAGPEVDPSGEVVGSWRGDGAAFEVVAGGRIPRAFLQRIAVTLVAPRRAGQEEEVGESLVGSSESLAEALAASHAVTQGFDGVLPRDLSPAFQAWGLEASASGVEARLVETGQGVVYPRSLRVCSGTAASHACGGEPAGSTLGDREIGGRTWSCADSAAAGQIRCRRTDTDGSWVAFQVTGTFTVAELDGAMGSLSSDLTGAAWAEA